MSAKYAGLPDIDTAPDVYESADVPPTFQQDESSSDEAATSAFASASNTPSKLASARKKKKRDDVQRATKEELDASHLMDMEKAEKKFKRAEARSLYAYPPSPGSTEPSSPTSPQKNKTPLSTRLAHLRAELSTLEAEISDPSNPLVIQDNVSPGELMRGLIDVQKRLECIRRGVGGRGALVNKLAVTESHVEPNTRVQPMSPTRAKATKDDQGLADMDRRVKELETVLGSSSTTLDDITPLPPPLLPMVNKLSNQLAILTQPRHIDSISRRLKLLLSDLDRMQSATTKEGGNTGSSAGDDPTSESNPLKLQEQILPLLTRVSPHIPQIPLVLTRLRTLAALHTSASSFDETLAGLEEEQRTARKGLQELSQAVTTIEQRMKENSTVTLANIQSLEQRVESVGDRLSKFDT